LQRDEVVRFAVAQGSVPDVLANGRASRGGADWLMLSGPGRSLTYEDGLTDSILNGVEDSLTEALYLLDGAPEGGIFDFANGPVLAAGAATGPGSERAAIALGVRLDPETLIALTDPTRRITL